jgi:tRNA A-37 threonylcarbamoyl transferase component Bud32
MSRLNAQGPQNVSPEDGPPRPEQPPGVPAGAPGPADARGREDEAPRRVESQSGGPSTSPDHGTTSDADTGGTTPGSFPPESAAGRRLGGYRLVALLGAGGMGEVYAAEEEADLPRRVAVKVMRPEQAARADARARFLREARAAARLQHDHVVPIYYVGEDGGVPFFVMPLLPGETLEDRLRRESALPPAEVLRVGREAAEGLAAAHAAGLVHRDVKPSNLWLEAPSGRVKVLDFGLAREAGSADGLTRDGAVVGTPGYLAPEQADGRPADTRCDLFGLGCVLYRAATGRPPFGGQTSVALLRAVAEFDPPAPSAVRPGVPAVLSDLILRLLEKDPADRPASAREVAATLRAVDGRPVAAPPRRARRPLRAALWALPAVLAGLALWRFAAPGPPVGPPAVPTGGAGARPAAAGPLRVDRLDVLHVANLQGKGQTRGVLGKKSFTAHRGDGVTVEAKLSRPAYAYLIAFRPDGTEDVCFPERADEPPPLTDRPRFPSASQGLEYGLDEGEGLAVFAVLASAEPLPPYREWRARRGAGPWRREATPPGVVWWYDGAGAEGLTANGERGAREAAGRAAVVRLADWLRREGGAEAVAAVGFAVLPKDGP